MSFSAAAAGSIAAGDGIASAVVPAHLGFLAIYNPSLGTTDETIEDQIVYYATGPSFASVVSNSTSTSVSHHRFHQPPPPLSPPPSSSPLSSSSCSSLAPVAHTDSNERNERLRQIGLAQGMIAFGKSFSGDQPVDTIETDKTRVVLHELEPGWWILVSINLTRLPLPGSANAVEYSSREVKPANLVLQDLLRAHAIFLLHHDVSLSALFARTASSSRSRFTTLLSRYWDVFLSSWSVLLHGNPVRDVFPGVRMAACGELGVGVGEEDRGSGEREVLEGLVEQTDGLVDLVVCKFGRVAEDAAEDVESVAAASDDAEDSIVGHDHPEEAFSGDDNKNSSRSSTGSKEGDWLGTGRGLGAEDGAIFLGVGALSRPSLRTISYWMEDIYSWGQNAYGVADDPSILPRHTKRRKRRSPTMSSTSEQQKQQRQERKQRQKEKQNQQQQPQSSDHPLHLLPPPPVTLLTRRAKQATTPIAVPGASRSDKQNTPEEAALSVSASPGNGGAVDKYMSFMKLGYGTYWGLGIGGAGPGSKSGDVTTEEHDNASASSKTGGPGTDAMTAAHGPADKPRAVKRAAVGRYLIGLTSETGERSAAGAKEDDEHQPPTEPSPSRPKTGPRTVVLELAAGEASRPSSQGTVRNFVGSHDHDSKAAAATEGASRSEKLRVVVFAKQPFLYTFLFRATAAEGAAVNEEALQANLSRQVTVLHKSLLGSTSYRPGRPSVAGASSLSTAAAASSGAIYDLIWDPRALTIHSTIPNIPDPGSHSHSTSTSTSTGNSAAIIQNAKRRDSSALDALLFPSWSRVEALNTHMQLLSTYAATRTNAAELERTCKTSRGWWVVWNRIVERSCSSPACRAGSTSETLVEEDEEDGDGDGDRVGSKRGSDDSRPSTATAATAAAATSYAVSKEIFLLRRAGDHADGRTASAAIRAISSSYLVRGSRGGAGAVEFGSGVGEGGLLGGGWADGASRLAQGMGVDTKKYIDGLLSLNR